MRSFTRELSKISALRGSVEIQGEANFGDLEVILAPILVISEVRTNFQRWFLNKTNFQSWFLSENQLPKLVFARKPTSKVGF